MSTLYTHTEHKIWLNYDSVQFWLNSFNTNHSKCFSYKTYEIHTEDENKAKKWIPNCELII